jgi:hypothetical protein
MTICWKTFDVFKENRLIIQEDYLLYSLTWQKIMESNFVCCWQRILISNLLSISYYVNQQLIFLNKENIGKGTSQIIDHNTSLTFSSVSEFRRQYFKEEQVSFIKYFVMISRYFIARTFCHGSREKTYFVLSLTLE